MSGPSKKNKLWASIGVALLVVAVVAFGLWNRLRAKPVSDTLFQKTRALVEKNPRLQPDWDKAMEDGVLTWVEAKGIIDKAGEKVEEEK